MLPKNFISAMSRHDSGQGKSFFRPSKSHIFLHHLAFSSSGHLDILTYIFHTEKRELHCKPTTPNCSNCEVLKVLLQTNVELYL